jgi:hypothetical protein
MDFEQKNVYAAASILAHDGVKHALAERFTLHIFTVALKNIGLMNRAAIHTRYTDTRLHRSILIGSSALNHHITDLQAFLLHRIMACYHKYKRNGSKDTANHHCRFFRPLL